MIKARWWVLALAAHGAVLGAQTRSNDLSAPERAAGWQLLFDGRTLRGWRGLGYDTVPTAHWVVVDGAIKKIASGTVPKLPDGQPAQGGDLMTLDTFGDFELSWEWKVTPGANSGVKYNVSEELSMAQAPNHAALGFEDLVLEPERGVVGRLRHGELLRHVVLDAAVRTGRDLPLPAQLEVTERLHRHQVAAQGGLSVRQLGDGAARDLFDRAIHHDPMGRGNGIVAQPAPPAQGATVEQQLPPGGSFGGAQIVRARLGAEHGALGRQGEDPPSSLDHMLPRFRRRLIESLFTASLLRDRDLAVRVKNGGSGGRRRARRARRACRQATVSFLAMDHRRRSRTPG